MIRGPVKEPVMDALPPLCYRAPELCESAKWGKIEDRSDTQQLPGPRVLQPGPRPHTPSAAGQGSTDKCKWSLLIRFHIRYLASTIFLRSELSSFLTSLPNSYWVKRVVFFAGPS